VSCPIALPSIEGCRSKGTALVTATYLCHDDGMAMYGTCPPGGQLTDYYAGLPCPFDVSIAHTPGWAGPAPSASAA
jgi:hypothetical protein